MIAALSRLWTHHRLLLAGFALALGVTLFFAVRLVVIAIYWNDPAHLEQPVAGWMTPRYVALSWDIPPDQVRAALGLSADRPQGRITLDEIARDRGIPASDLIDALAPLTTSKTPQ